MTDKEKNNSSISINNDDQQQQNDNLEENKKQNEDDPFLWPKKKKWIILSVLSCGAIIAPISSTIFYPAFLTVQEQLHTSDILVTTSGK
uniref:Uncharacterized protein n=1 Tax=Rhizophagus irregularis (strain DAOM 181602 / DAOM 197198 / MUCL 43194) TaxID=747089 RepID=U9TNE9_RHIID